MYINITKYSKTGINDGNFMKQAFNLINPAPSLAINFTAGHQIANSSETGEYMGLQFQFTFFDT